MCQITFGFQFTRSFPRFRSAKVYFSTVPEVAGTQQTKHKQMSVESEAYIQTKQSDVVCVFSVRYLAAVCIVWP